MPRGEELPNTCYARNGYVEYFNFVGWPGGVSWGGGGESDCMKNAACVPVRETQVPSAPLGRRDQAPPRIGVGIRLQYSSISAC